MSIERRAAAGRSLLRPSELIVIAYFLYAAGVALFLPIPASVAGLAVGVNAAVVVAFLLLAYADRARPRPSLTIFRDWMTLGVVVLAYRQMGWFAPSHHTYELENSWVVWDRLLLNHWGLRGAIESLGPLMPSLLELSYALVYAMGPFAVAMLYAYGKQDRVGRFLVAFVLGTLLCYALFPYFPSEPPRAVFPGQDFPTVNTIFRQFNWWMLGNTGIHTSVFPSAHVSAAFAVAFAMLRWMPRPRWVSLLLLVMAIFIFVATIYGRYHYAVDAVAGLAVAVIAIGIAILVERYQGKPAPGN